MSEQILENGEACVVRRLGPGHPDDYIGIVRGVYNIEHDTGLPAAYIVELAEFFPGDRGYDCMVFVRSVVDPVETV